MARYRPRLDQTRWILLHLFAEANKVPGQQISSVATPVKLLLGHAKKERLHHHDLILPAAKRLVYGLRIVWCSSTLGFGGVSTTNSEERNSITGAITRSL